MPKTRQSASDDEDDALALRLVALLNDDQVLAKLKSVLYPRELYDKIAAFTDRVTSLTVDLAAKDAKIEELTTRVDSLEAEADRQEQYSRRPNLRFQGVPSRQRAALIRRLSGWSTSAWDYRPHSPCRTLNVPIDLARLKTEMVEIAPDQSSCGFGRNVSAIPCTEPAPN